MGDRQICSKEGQAGDDFPAMNSLERIRIDGDGRIKSFSCPACGFTTPTVDGVWGKDIWEMEEEHMDYLHSLLRSSVVERAPVKGDVAGPNPAEAAKPE